MKKLVFNFCLLALTQVSMAEDYYLDATTMGVGATAGENFVVKEGCLDPDETGCSDKYKWFGSVSPIKIGNLQVVGQVTGDFEIIVTADFVEDPKTIQLLTADNKGISLKFKGDRGSWSFRPNGIGEGGDSRSSSWLLSGWNNENNFNELKISAQNGVANVYTNGQVAGEPINFDSGVVFERVAIEGITSKDRLIDVKVRGIQGGVSCPDSGGGIVPPVNNQLPTISPNLNLHIPSLDYQSLGGSMNLWVDLQFTTTDDGKMWWILDDYGVNP